jgi:enoyl-CoA hydratase/carnithine racemase
MTSAPPVLVEVREQRMYVTMNRPEVLNAQNQPMRVALVEAFDRFDADPDLRVAILSGAGRAFSAGADIKEMQARTDERADGDAAGPAPEQNPTHIHFDRVWQTDKPVIAAIHGFAVGGGFELSQLCDLRVVTRDAQLGQPEPRNIGGLGSFALQHLHHLVPRGEAMLVHMTGAPISGERAYQVGLAQRLADDRDGALAAADALAEEVLQCSAASLRRIKQVLRAEVDDQVARQIALSKDLPPFDHREGADRRATFLAR